jgi:hypothetical protein
MTNERQVRQISRPLRLREDRRPPRAPGQAGAYPAEPTADRRVATATVRRAIAPEICQRAKCQSQSGSCLETAPSTDMGGAAVFASGVGSTTAPPAGVIDAPRGTSSSLSLGALVPMVMFSGREARMSAASVGPHPPRRLTRFPLGG